MTEGSRACPSCGKPYEVGGGARRPDTYLENNPYAEAMEDDTYSDEIYHYSNSNDPTLTYLQDTRTHVEPPPPPYPLPTLYNEEPQEAPHALVKVGGNAVTDLMSEPSSYGFGNVLWTKREDADGDNVGDGVEGGEGGVKGYKHLKLGLARKVPLSPGHVYPYRFMVVFRFFATAAFISYRLRTPNTDARYLWLMSVWFFLSWILDQTPKWAPVQRHVHVDRLEAKYAVSNTRGELLLPAVDAYITTADATREPPLVTANTILSILALDYPQHKLAVYLSDDGASKLMFDTMAETACFARVWVPFAREAKIEPRAPAQYFSKPMDYTGGYGSPDFVRQRMRMKRAYDEFCGRVGALVREARAGPPEGGWAMPDGSPWPGQKRSDHDGIIQVFLPLRDRSVGAVPGLVYVSREKRPGAEHHKKAGAMNALVRASALLTNGEFMFNVDCDHYINNSNVVKEALCFFLDPIKGANTGYVQFPQRFDGIDAHDRYANNNVVFFDANMRGMDGSQGPLYVGTGCFFRRQALYGRPPPGAKEALLQGSKGKLKHKKKKSNKHGSGNRGCLGNLLCCCCCCCGKRNKTAKVDPDPKLQARMMHPLAESLGPSRAFAETTLTAKLCELPPRELLSEVVLSVSCEYDTMSEWGAGVGWVYGTVTEDIVTGYQLHCLGWRSVYHTPQIPAFKGTAPINLTDRLQQVLRWATGSIEIFFSGNNPFWAAWGSGLKGVQRTAYMATMVYPFTSCILVVYCSLPAVCLLANQFIVAQINGVAVLYYGALFLGIIGTSYLEVQWSGITLDDFWRNEQFWVISGTSAHFAAVWQGLLKNIFGLQVAFSITQKSDDDENEFYQVRWSWLLFVPLLICFANALALIAGVAREVNQVTGLVNYAQLLSKVIFSLWVLVHYWPFLKGLFGRRRKPPTIVVVWLILLALTFSIFWSKYFNSAEAPAPSVDIIDIGA
eukprot:jgi/Chlat1/638/Chrsp103S00964